MGLASHSTLQAQQGWSPQPFVPDANVRPLSSATSSPANRLRGDSPPVDDKPVVLRWKSQSSAEPSRVSSQQAFDDRPLRASTPVSPSAVAQAADWSNRNATQSQRGSRLVRSVVEPTSYQEGVDSRDESPIVIRPAQFEAPPAGNPGDALPTDLFESNLIEPKEPLPPADAAPGATNPNSPRSLLDSRTEEPSPVPANPFPKRSDPRDLDWMKSDDANRSSRDSSPSDSELPPPNLRDLRQDKNGKESAPPKPQSASRKDVNCDDVRQRVLAANIDTIQLDVAPNFGVGPKDKQSAEEKRDAFVKSAPYRSWNNHDGTTMADGRLADFSNDAIVIEGRGGQRQSIAIRELSEADAAYVFEAWGLPVTCSLGAQQIAARIYEPTTVAWKASGLCHKPLYFEEIQLERSGHEYGPVIQPAISTVHFFKNIAVLPYKMGIHPMTECQYALGHYRPGNCAPWSIEPIPLSLRGLAAQATAVGGATMLLP